MSNRDTTDNFWQVWSSFQWPAPQVIEYRLYYNQDGSPRIYTMEDLPGDYITVDQSVYVAASFDVKVVDGQLKFLPKQVYRPRLQPGAHTGTLCHSQDVCVVVATEPGVKWDIEQNENY